MMRLGGVAWALRKRLTNSLFIALFVHAELAIAVLFGSWRMLEPVQRGLPRQHSAIGAARFELARDKAEHGIVAQLIVIVQILIAKRNAMDALGDQRFDRVLDPVLPAAVLEAGRHLPRQARYRDPPRATTARPHSRLSPRRRTPL